MTALRTVAVVGLLLLAGGSALLAVASYPIIVIADSGLGAGAMERVHDAVTMLAFSAGAAVFALGFIPGARVRICLGAALLTVVAVLRFRSDDVPDAARWPLMALLALMMVADYAGARRDAGRPLAPLGSAALALLLPGLVLLSDWGGRIFFRLLPSGGAPPPSVRERLRTSVSLMAGDPARRAVSAPLRLKAVAGGEGSITLSRLDGGPTLRLPGGRDRTVSVLTFSPDGKVLAAGTGETYSGSAVALWDVTPGSTTGPPTATLRHTLRGPRQWAAFCLDFFPDGRTLLSGNGDNTVSLWDVATGREQARFDPGHRASGGWDLTADCVAAAPDGNTFATWGGDGIRLWDRRSLRPLQFLRTRGAIPCALAFTGDGRELVAEDRGAVHTWQIRPSPLPFLIPVLLTSLLLGRMLLSGGSDGTTGGTTPLTSLPRHRAASGNSASA